MPTLYSVGQPYSPTRNAWPDGIDYNFRGGAHELRIFMNGIESVELESVKSGAASFSLYTYLDVVFFNFKFGILSWNNAPYSIHLIGEDERQAPDISDPNAHALLTTFLVEGQNGLIRSIRVCTFSTQFTLALHKAILKQMDRGWPGDNAYDEQVKRIYNQYSPAELGKRLATHHCKGGD